MTLFKPLTQAERNRLVDQWAWALSTKTRPVLVPGEAILAIEAVAASVAGRGRKFLNIVTGPYGQQFSDWLRSGGADVVDLSTPYDCVVTAATVEEAIKQHHPDAVAFVQAEAVTGGSNPTEAILAICQQQHIITIIDAVSAIGAEPVLMDSWGIDIVVVGAQKALAGPNGISAVGVSSRGWNFIETNREAPRHSALSLLDLKNASDYIAPAAANLPILEARALLSAFEKCEAEGLAAITDRHQRAAASARAGVRQLGLKLWQCDARSCSPLVTTVRLAAEQMTITQPVGMVTPGDGALYGQLLRLNHFGEAACEQRVEEAMRVLAVLAAAPVEAALEAVRKVWVKENED
ncbi:MAG: aminotransferase class V-fold PLP-dependent enzyme [Sporolactobacillus sp.]